MNKSHFSKLLLLSLLCVSLTAGCFKSDAPKAYVDPSSYILPNNNLSPILKQILEITGIEHENTLDSVVQATQKSWLRKPGVERWQMDKKFENLGEQLAPLFTQLGILNKIKPSYKQYDEAIILGATVGTMRERLAYALDLWHDGVRFKKLTFLVGERPRDLEKETVEVLYNYENKFVPIKADWQQPNIVPATETEMAKMIYDQAQLPEGFRESVKATFIDTPMQLTIDGGTRRPNTGDTIKLWLESAIPQDSILAISNQPYVGYQHTVLKSFVPTEMSIETVGPKANPTLNFDVLLDNLARWLYQENTLQKKEK